MSSRQPVVPDELKGLRACLCCGLIKTAMQFREDGCDNCTFITYDYDEYTSAYFEGMIGLADPANSWVASWQRNRDGVPGTYAIDVIGRLPEDIIQYCEEKGIPYRGHA